MADAIRSERELRRELVALRRRVAELERERQVADRVIHGDPDARRDPLLAQVPAILWVANTELRLLWWTGGGIRALDVRPSEAIGTDIYSFMGTGDPDNPAIAAHRKALRGEACSFEAEREGVFVTAHVGPCHDADGAITGVIGVAIDISARVRAETRLRRALERVNTLSGLIPICMHCKNVRNDAGYWEQVESYIHQHSLADFTHAICPECMRHALEEPRSR
jgi:hypothetical protein